MITEAEVLRFHLAGLHLRDHSPKLEVEDVEDVKRSDKAEGFQALAHRRVAEKIFSSRTRHRRPVRDHDNSSTTAEAVALMAMIRIQIRRLA